MTTQPHKLLNAALSLPASDRAEIAASLLRSLDPPDDPQADAGWAAEIERRVQSIDNGDVKLVPWSDVIATLPQRRDG
jgi:putative addiction module component (TIGR02574 family)